MSTGRARTGSNASIVPLPMLQAAVDGLFAAHPPIFATLESWRH